MDPDIADGLKRGLLWGAALLALVLPQTPLRTAREAPATEAAATVELHHPAPAVARLDLGGRAVAADVERLGRWVVASSDHGGRAFAVVDKKGAHVYVFAGSGRLLGATPVLLGNAVGDDSVAGIGKRLIADVRPEERTTPAGRFIAEAGRNIGHEDVIWVDYDAAVSMHRVRVNDPREHRLERLATPTPSDNRISYGCINVPVAFFEQVLWPAFSRQRGVVYVLPEIKPMSAVFPALQKSTAFAP